MKKILDILIIVLLTILVVNLFSGTKEKILDDSLSFEFSDSSYTIPATVIINAKNNTKKDVLINKCKDIQIRYSGELLEFDDSFCEDSDIIIKSGSTKTINYGEEYSKFENIGKYNLTIKLSEKEYFDQFELENSGTFKKLFIGLFYAPIYNLMIFLLDLFNGMFGYAIVVITILIRVALLWPQHKMMISQKKLQALQPKIKQIQKEFKGNQQVLGMKMMELYKKEKVNPMGSCGFLLIQMPILLVIYRIILGIKDSSNHFYIYDFLSKFNLNSIDYNFFGLNLLESGGIAGAILAITVAIIQFFQIKLSLAGKKQDNKNIVLEKKKEGEGYSQFMPDPDTMNKFMLYGMPAMVGVFTYTLFAGVGIYWGISTLFMLVQQFIVNKILNK